MVIVVKDCWQKVGKHDKNNRIKENTVGHESMVCCQDVEKVPCVEHLVNLVKGSYSSLKNLEDAANSLGFAH